MIIMCKCVRILHLYECTICLWSISVLVAHITIPYYTRESNDCSRYSVLLAMCVCVCVRARIFLYFSLFLSGCTSRHRSSIFFYTIYSHTDARARFSGEPKQTKWCKIITHITCSTTYNKKCCDRSVYSFFYKKKWVRNTEYILYVFLHAHHTKRNVK